MMKRFLVPFPFLFPFLILVPFLIAEEPVPPKLVDLGTISPPPLLEIRYATTYNFTGRVLYPMAAAFLHPDAAAALSGVQKELAAEGLGLKVFDGYRPLHVQRLMWETVPDERYVSNPDKNKGRHTRGTAVDVTLIDRLGKELDMPTGFDDFTARAHWESTDWSPAQRTNAEKLATVMEKHGFQRYPFEWWHFDLKGWEKYEPLDVSFESCRE